MKYVKIHYEIALFNGYEAGIRQRVTGYAFEHFRHKLCARKINSHLWTVDDYLTGFTVSHGDTRENAVYAACTRIDNRGDSHTQERREDAYRRMRRAGLLI